MFHQTRSTCNFLWLQSMASILGRSWYEWLVVAPLQPTSWPSSKPSKNSKSPSSIFTKKLYQSDPFSNFYPASLKLLHYIYYIAAPPSRSVNPPILPAAFRLRHAFRCAGCRGCGGLPGARREVAADLPGHVVTPPPQKLKVYIIGRPLLLRETNGVTSYRGMFHKFISIFVGAHSAHCC